MEALVGSRSASVGDRDDATGVSFELVMKSGVDADGSADPVGNSEVLGTIENVGNKDGALLELGASLVLGA